MKFLAVVLSIYASESATVDCEYVRAMVAQHGKIAAYAWALANGYRPKDISRIRKQCGV